MTLYYDVSLTGIKGFLRRYKVSGSSTLYSLHKKMQSDMEFPLDQVILFKGMTADGEVAARYGMFDLGSGSVDSVTLEQTAEAGVVSFVYFYDVPGRRSVNISLSGSDESLSDVVPVLVEQKGPNPIEFERGYVALEDMPQLHRRPSKEESPLDGLLSALEDDSLLGGDDDAAEDEDDVVADAEDEFETEEEEMPGEDGE